MKPSIKDNAPDFHIFLICPGGVLANQKQQKWWDPSGFQQMSQQTIPVWEVNLFCYPSLPFLHHPPAPITHPPFPTRRDHIKSTPNRWDFPMSKAPRKIHLVFISMTNTPHCHKTLPHTEALCKGDDQSFWITHIFPGALSCFTLSPKHEHLSPAP